MIFTKNHYKGVQCVFKDAPATMIGHHEFANYPDKPLCEEHYRKLLNFMTRKVKR